MQPWFYISHSFWRVKCWFILNTRLSSILFLILRFKSNEPSWGCSHASQFIWISGSKTCLCVPGLDSDESCEGTSEASFKDAVVYDGAQKNNGAVPRENGIKKHRYSQIPALWHIRSLSLPLIFLSLSSFSRFLLFILSLQSSLVHL